MKKQADFLHRTPEGLRKKRLLALGGVREGSQKPETWFRVCMRSTYTPGSQSHPMFPDDHSQTLAGDMSFIL